MAKADIRLPDGTTIKLEGSTDEISAVVEQWREKQQETAQRGKREVRTKSSRPKRQRIQLVDLVANLIDGGFFKKPKDLAAVKTALAELGHHYPLTTLSGAMLRQVRRRNLRRLKEEKRWMYTG